MLFEGSEKKIEIVVSDQVSSLREKGDEFWSAIVKKSEAQVLSKISSDSCDAYLLSESSLFVWDDYFTMITCGQTQLISAVEHFVKDVSQENIQSLIFERKNEYFPRHQHTDFYDDSKRLNELFPGKAYRFGSADGHHLFLYHLDRAYQPVASDTTLEILMYDLQGSSKEIFSCVDQSAQEIREKTGVDKIFDGFQVDDHVFNPCGYSLNALRGRDYYTIHVTPEEQGSYVSFETNVDLQNSIQPALMKVLEVFQPNDFDVIVFRPKGSNEIDEKVSIEGFVQATAVHQGLSCGYEVSYTHQFKKRQDTQPATELKEF